MKTKQKISLFILTLISCVHINAGVIKHGKLVLSYNIKQTTFLFRSPQVTHKLNKSAFDLSSLKNQGMLFKKASPSLKNFMNRFYAEPLFGFSKEGKKFSITGLLVIINI